MSVRAGAVVLEGIDQVDTVKRFPLGTVVDLGNDAYMYVQGVASGAVNKWVTVTTAGVTTLLAANAVGMVGIMCSTLDATTDFGFIQIKALTGRDADVATAAAANTVPYITATGGRVDDAVVVGDKVYNALILSTEASNVSKAFLNHPYVTNESN